MCIWAKTKEMCCKWRHLYWSNLELHRKYYVLETNVQICFTWTKMYWSEIRIYFFTLFQDFTCRNTFFWNKKNVLLFYLNLCVSFKERISIEMKKYIHWNCGSHSQLKVWGNVDWEGQVCVNYWCVFRCFVKALKLISILIEGRNGRKMIYWKRLVKKTKNTGV